MTNVVWGEHLLKELPQKLPRLIRYPADLVGGLAVELEIEFGLRGAVGRAAPGFQLFAAEGALRQRGSRVTAMLMRGVQRANPAGRLRAFRG